MNTSTPEARTEPLAVPADQGQPRWQQRHLSPARGLIYLTVFAVVALGLALNFQAIWDVATEVVILCLEIAEELMDSLLEVMGIAPGTAQMATAYIGLLVFLALLYFLARKSMNWARRVGETLQDYRDMYAHLLRSEWIEVRTGLIAWWKDLDWLARTGVVVFTVLVLVPLILGLSVGLGMLVAALL